MEGTIFFIVLGVMFAAVLMTWMVSLASKGARGEQAVHGILRQSLPASDYTILRDVTLRAGAGTVRIDHVVVSRFGIFVIETRHLPGCIIGAEQDSHWVQSHGHSRVEFHNPLHENRAHIRALQALLGLKATRFHPLVVFSGKAQFRKPMPLNVVKLDRLLPFIEIRTTQMLTAEETRRAVELIESSRLTPDAAAEPLQVQSLRARRGAVAPAVAPVAGTAMTPSRQRITVRFAARALADPSRQ